MPHRFSESDLNYGCYYRQEEIAQEAPEIMEEWERWLDAQIDPGHYDAYKVCDQSVLPYIDGRPQWVCAVFMPGYLVRKLKGILDAKQEAEDAPVPALRGSPEVSG